MIGENDKEFDLSWNHKEPIQHPPAEIKIVHDQVAGRVLHACGLFLEEVSAVGVALTNSQAGDGLRFRVKVDTEAVNLMVPAVQSQPLDFLLYATATPSTFDWRPFLPAPDLAKLVQGYDRNLTCTKLSHVPNLSLAIHHARRFVAKGQWRDITIPFSDFLCIYGCGDLTNRFHGQLPPDSRKLIAVAVLAPWPRQGRWPTAIDIQGITLMKLKQTDGNRRSYFQFPDVTNLKTIKSRQGGFSILLSPGETNLPVAMKRLLDELE